jgi:hypothetical protein
MNAPVKTYYTISCSMLLQQCKNNRLGLDESVYLNLLLDIPHSQMTALFSLVGAMKNNYMFSLPCCLFNNHDTLKEILPACYILASMNNFSTNGQAVIPILWNSLVEKVTDTDISIIEDYFREQGIENIHIPFFEYSQEAEIQHTTSCSFYVYHENALENPGNTTMPASSLKLIAFSPDTREIEKINQMVSKIKSTVAEENLQDNYIETQLFEEEIQHWQKRALLYRDFLQLSKTVQQKEYYEVIDWYHKEYEILPLWYKRFGHIIKVIMGKRSFRSLFNHNVKKYKD